MKYLLSFFVCLSSMLAYSQVEESTILIGTSFNLSSETDPQFTGGMNSDGKETSFSMTQDIGYAFSTHWVGGVTVNYASERVEVDQSIGDINFPNNPWDDDFPDIPGNPQTQTLIEQTQQLFEPGVFVARFIPISERFSALPRVDVSFGTTKTEVSTNGPGLSFEDTTKRNHFAYGFSSALFYDVTDWLGLQASLIHIGGKSTEPAAGSSDRSSEFNASVNPEDWQFGVVLLF